MDMKKYIEMGEEKAGNQVKLAKFLNIQPSTLGLVKMGKKSLTAALCLKLAQFIEVDEVKVISASNLIIEKNPERRKIFESYLKGGSKAASFALIAVFLSVNLIMTPTPANASQQTFDMAEEFILC